MTTTNTTSISETLTSSTSPLASSEAESTKKSTSSSKYKGVVPQPNGRWGAQIYEKHRRVWLGTFSRESDAACAYDVAVQRFRGRDAVTNLKPLLSDQPDPDAIAELSFLHSHSKSEIVDMLRKHTYSDELSQSRRATGPPSEFSKIINAGKCRGQRELLFDKVVTPSDVGKLNRLVIPKQQAERHFPLSGESCKGVLINFEDSGGRVWRFRYSYWNSSQSYVLTKGWSRFVKEKGLKAGDAVSFWRSTATEVRRLFIDTQKGDCTAGEGEGEQVVRLFGVDISESRKRGRDVEAFSQTLLFKKPLIVAL